MPNSYAFAPAYDEPDPRSRTMPNWKLQGTALVEDTGTDEDEVEDDEYIDTGYDPSDHTVEEVKAYVEANPEFATTVLAAEVDGKNRVTLVEWLSDDGG